MDFQRSAVLFSDARVLSLLHEKIDFIRDKKANLFYDLYTKNLIQINFCINNYKNIWNKKNRCKVYKTALNALKKDGRHLDFSRKNIIDDNIDCEKYEESILDE